MHLDSQFLLSVVWLLVAATLAVGLSSRLGLGSILGLLVAGIVVGPYSPGPVLTENVDAVRQFTELGVVLLLFLIGTEMRPARLWSMRRQVFALGGLQVLITGALITTFDLLFAASWQAALITGMTLALSSTAFVMQILHERGETASAHGTVAFSILLMQDLAVVPLLALVPVLSDQGTLSASVPLTHQIGVVLAMIALVLLFGLLVVPWVLERLTRERNREGFLLAVMLAVFLAAWAMERSGMSMALGAFLMGMLLSSSRFHFQIQAHVEPYKGLLMSLFFVAVGMSIDLEAVADDPLRLAQQVAIIVGIKVLVILGLGLVFRIGAATSVRVAFLLAQAGEFGFVLFGTAKGMGVISDQTFVLGAAVISVSMLLTPLLIRIGNALAARLAHLAVPLGAASPGDDTRQGQVVIGGYGRVGHSVAVLLRASDVPVVVVESDPERLQRGLQDGFQVYFGDIADPHLHTAMHMEHAAMVILAVDNPRTALKAVSHLRNAYADLPLLARAKDLEGVGHLMNAGATSAFPEILESSMRLGAEAMHVLGVAGEDVDRLMAGVRSTSYEAIR